MAPTPRLLAHDVTDREAGVSCGTGPAGPSGDTSSQSGTVAGTPLSRQLNTVPTSSITIFAIFWWASPCVQGR